MTAELHYLPAGHVQCVRSKEGRVSRNLIALPRIIVLAWRSFGRDCPRGRAVGRVLPPFNPSSLAHHAF